ncbi:MAG: hypothetical protein EBU59_13145, partial [Planctomycetia bacterium]|nr:hypothetical protein [Planctomycetia bacterium]
ADASSAVTIASNAHIVGRTNVDITSTAKHNVAQLARSVGGGLVAIADADVTANLNHTATITVAESAKAFAKDTLTVASASEGRINSRAITLAGGLGADVDTNAAVTVGKADNRSRTGMDIAGDLQGTMVNLSSMGTLAGVAYARANSGGLYAGADANATLDIYDQVDVTLASTARIAGEVVSITAAHDTMAMQSIARAYCGGLFAEPDSLGRTTYDSINTVDAKAGAIVSAADLAVSSTQGISLFDRDPQNDADGIDVGGNPVVQGSLNARRSINWDADVTFLGKPTPELLIAADGTVVTAEGVTVNNGQAAGASLPAGPITVDAITNTTNGKAAFTVGPAPSHDGETAAKGTLSGTAGTFSSGTVLPSVTLTNLSDSDLVLGDISLTNATAVPAVTLTAEDVTLEFDVGSLTPAGEMQVNVINKGSGNVVVDGLIKNPVGSITIENT